MSILPKERTALIESIHQAIGSLRGHVDERHHLLNVLGFVSGCIHEAKAVTTADALQKQIDLLSREIAALRNRT